MNPRDATEAERALRRRLDDLAETQRWVHHVADLDSGELQSTTLDRPVTPVSRLQRLSRLGHHFDASIFGGPSYRLTPRRPYQESPRAWINAMNPDYLNTYEDHINWQPPRVLGANFIHRGLSVHFMESPHERSVVSIALSGYAHDGMTGHVRVSAAWSSAVVRFPIGDSFAAMTVDLTFVPLGGRESDILMTIEAGVRLLDFTSISFRAQPLVLDPG